MRRIGVFLEPEGELLTQVGEWKTRVERHFRVGTAYLSHPPHVSVYVFELDEKECSTERMCERFAMLSETVRSARITSDRVICFEGDLMTGGDTVAYAFSKESESLLKSVQSAVVELLSPCAVIPPGASYGELMLEDGPFGESLEKYGFPFVGEIWIPHCTVASLPQEDSNELKKSFLSQTVEFAFPMKKLSLWEIQGESHERIADLKLT